MLKRLFRRMKKRRFYGDINPEDNDDRSFVDVIPESADITPYFDWTTGLKLYNSVFVNEEQQLIAFVRNIGKSDANDVSLSADFCPKLQLCFNAG